MTGSGRFLPVGFFARYLPFFNLLLTEERARFPLVDPKII
jgi:hypothetical protein